MAGCNIFRRLTFAVSAVSILLASSCTSKVNNPNYANNPAPLHPNVFIELPLGSIKASLNCSVLISFTLEHKIEDGKTTYVSVFGL